MKIEEFKAYLDEQTYDKYYQDITCIGFTGYSESFKTWERIKDEVSWTNKIVADLGCFHGYFCFQIAKAGGNVTGFDKSAMVLKTTDIINELEGGLITTKVWEDTQPIIGKYDIVLCLNALHHFSDPDAFLKNIDCDIGIFEINLDMEDLISKYFVINKKIPSHRENRIILITRKCRPLPDKRFKEIKLFVTGIYASGKSDYARSYANKYQIPYINFDTNFSYDKTKRPASEDVIFNLLEDTYIIDAIPFALENGSTKRFFEYARTHDVRIICCVCSDKDSWMKRLEDVKRCSLDVSRSNIRVIHYGFSDYKYTLEHIGAMPEAGWTKETFTELAPANWILNETECLCHKVPLEWFPEENIPEDKWAKPKPRSIASLKAYDELE